MGRLIVHHNDLFFEWSTVVDAPVSCAMTRAEFESYYQSRHGSEGMKDLPARLQRALESGCSAHDRMSAADCVIGNRAGDGECEMPFDELIAYVKAARDEFGLPPLPAESAD